MANISIFDGSGSVVDNHYNISGITDTNSLAYFVLQILVLGKWRNRHGHFTAAAYDSAGNTITTYSFFN